MKRVLPSLFLFCILSIQANSQNAGVLDNSFGTNGFADGGQVLFSQFGGIVEQPDSSIICVQRIGSGVYDIVLARFLSDGSLDNSFGNGGVALTVTAIDETPTCVALQNDGKILVGSGSSDGSGGFGTVSRYKTNGTPDSTFAVNGIYKSKFPGANSDGVGALVVLSNGEIIAGGNTLTNPIQKSSIIKLFPNGTLDSTFGVNGRATGNTMIMFSMAVQPDGKFLLGGRTGLKMAITRYTSAGIIDSTFGTNGIVATNHNITSMSWAVGLFVLPNGNIIGAGGLKTSNLLVHEFMAMEVDSNGVINTNYGNNGTAVDSMPSAYIITPTAAAVQVDSKVIIAGAIGVDSATGYRMAMVRFNANGTVDQSFGNNGMSIASQGSRGYCDAIAIQTDNKILLGGSRDFGSGNSTIAVARFGSGTVTSGIEDVPSNYQELNLYPNPANNEITIQPGKQGDYEIGIFNMLGQLVQQQKITVDGNGKSILNVSACVPGIYQIAVSGKPGNQYGRFVKD